MSLRDGGRRGRDSRARAFALLDQVEQAAAEAAEHDWLVAQAQAGDDLAYAELYIALFDPVRRWLEIALRDRHEAQDAAQAVFERALRALPRYNPGDGGFRPWVFSIARNLAFDHLKAAARSTCTTDPQVLTEQSDRQHHVVADPTPRLEAAGVSALIAHLPPLQRRVLALRFVSDLDPIDIADALGTTPAAVRQAQHRALRSLQRTLNASYAPGEEPSNSVSPVISAG